MVVGRIGSVETVTALLGRREAAVFDRERPDLPDVHADLVHRDGADRAVVAVESGPALRELVAITLEIVGLVGDAGRLDARLGDEELIVHRGAGRVGALAPGPLEELLHERLHARDRALVPGVRRGVPALDGVAAEIDGTGRGRADASLDQALVSLPVGVPGVH